MSEHLLVRPAESGDEAALTDLAVVNSMFAFEELDDFVAMFRGAVAGELDDHRWFVSVAPDGRVAAAYLAPEPFADRLWNVSFLAVSPAEHGRGAGSDLLRHLEGALRDAGEEAAS